MQHICQTITLSLMSSLEKSFFSLFGIFMLISLSGTLSVNSDLLTVDI